MSPFAVFLTIVLGVWAAMHTYVFWRISTLPWVARNLPWWAIACVAFALWLSFPLARMLEGRAPDTLVLVLEYLASNWVGILFLLLCAFLAVDVFTLGGALWHSKAGQIRAWALVVGCGLACIALVQGHRSPIVTEHVVELKNLPPERNGTVLVAISDIHLGTILGERWLSRIVERVNGLQPDALLLVGDIVDGNVKRVLPFRDTLAGLKAPLGAWAVTGNHDYYAGADKSVAFMQSAGIRVLRDSSAELAPGLFLAGVDDLTARAQFRLSDHPVEKALAGQGDRATVFLSHTPLQIETAAANGAGLMLCGHTHEGQIWPFTYLVKLRYPFVAGSYRTGGMDLIVGRGTGTWGPRMRLWQRGEILRIVLRSPGSV